MWQTIFLFVYGNEYGTNDRSVSKTVKPKLASKFAIFNAHDAWIFRVWVRYQCVQHPDKKSRIQVTG